MSDFGKCFKSVDGREWINYEDAMEYNSIYYEKMKKQPKDNNITVFGKGITFKSIDGREWSTYEDAITYNEMYCEKMKSEDEKGMHR